MSGLIDKKKLLKVVLEEYAEGNYYVLNLIRDFPAENAVTPVRCQECRYVRTTQTGRILCRMWNGCETRADGFCWKGRTDGNN